MFYVLPDDDHLTVGVPTTYRAFAIGGATIRATDRWSIVQYGPSSFQSGGSTFTFTPQRAGHVTVCLQRRPGNTPMDQLGACFDPVVRRGAGATTPTPDPVVAPSAGPTTAPSAGLSLPTPGASPVAGEGATQTPGQVAVAATGPSTTTDPAPAPSDGPAAAPAAPDVALLVLLLAGGVVLGGAIVARPGVRARLRSRVDR
jgi:hypothetical protein